eukprot:379252_1
MSSQDEGMESYDEDDTMIQNEGELYEETDDSSSYSNALKLRPQRNKTKQNQTFKTTSTKNNRKTSKNNIYHSNNELKYSNKTLTPKKSINSSNKHKTKSHSTTGKPTKSIHRIRNFDVIKQKQAYVKPQSIATQMRKLNKNASVKSQNENENKKYAPVCECDTNTCLGNFFFICFCTLCAVISIIILVTGVTWYEKGNKYENESTKQLCYLIGYEYQDCNCGNGDSDEGACFGYLYKYTATATDKCGDIILMNDYSIIDGNCKGNDVPKDLNKEYECYVLDCNDAKFTFAHHSDYIERGVIYIVLGCVFLLCPICVIIIYVFEYWPNQ